MNDYTDEAAATKRGRGIRKCHGCDQPVPAPGHYDHARGCPEDAVAKAEKDAREKAIREAADWHLAQAAAMLKAHDGNRAQVPNFWNGYLQAHEWSARDFGALLARPSEPVKVP